METAAPARLTYLFEAHFFDGTRITQTQEDVSLYGGINAYSDVLARLDEVVVFGLFSEDGHTALVDLRDGHMEINKAPFYPLPTDENITPGGKYRLIYWRKRTKHRSFVEAIGEDGQPILDGRGEPVLAAHDFESPSGFMIGWEYILNGAALHKQVILVY